MFNIGDKVYFEVGDYSDRLDKGLVVGIKTTRDWNNKTEYVIEYEMITYPDSTDKADKFGRYFYSKGKGVKETRYIVKINKELFVRNV